MTTLLTQLPVTVVILLKFDSCKIPFPRQEDERSLYIPVVVSILTLSTILKDYSRYSNGNNYLFDNFNKNTFA